jgi:selenocysteine lyase/cysteine desulfurase
VAALLGCGVHEVALFPHVSAGLAAVASALDYGDRTRVVCADLDFPTLSHQWLARGRDGVEVAFARTEDGMGVPPQAYAEVVDERTGLVATSHVFFTTGWRQDLGALAALAHDSGALLLVDAYQSAGIIPLPVKELGVDMLMSGGLKWLLGGPGIAWLYVDEQLHDQLDPRATGWFAVEDQFAFNTTERRLRSDARRLEGGTPSPAAVYAARAGIDLVLEHGVERLGARTLELVDTLTDLARQGGWDVLVPASAEERSGIVIIPHPDPHGAVAALAKMHVIVDARPTGIRISPYAYNTTEDLERLLQGLPRPDRP